MFTHDMHVMDQLQVAHPQALRAPTVCHIMAQTLHPVVCTPACSSTPATALPCLAHPRLAPPRAPSPSLLLPVPPKLAASGLRLCCRQQRQPGGGVRTICGALCAAPAGHVGGAIPGMKGGREGRQAGWHMGGEHAETGGSGSWRGQRVERTGQGTLPVVGAQGVLHRGPCLLD
jgi:hypothetical protein